GEGCLHGCLPRLGLAIGHFAVSLARAGARRACGEGKATPSLGGMFRTAWRAEDGRIIQTRLEEAHEMLTTKIRNTAAVVAASIGVLGTALVPAAAQASPVQVYPTSGAGPMTLAGATCG